MFIEEIAIPSIKICGVTDPGIAAFAAKNGAHYIGMILTPGFRRSVTLAQAKQIADAARENGSIPVGVFVSAQLFEIESICCDLDIERVQAYQFSSVFPNHLKRIFINETDATFRTDCDFLLMESGKPGSGEKMDESHFSAPLVKPWFIAGGLNPENVKATILRYRPDGVDVSSGVEKEGLKNRELILEFIKEVKSCE
jgi:phosphoribosylanthranilate isomerase